MALIRVQNNLQEQSTKTFLSSSVTNGGTVLPVRNTNTFNANWAIQVGNVGEEKSEILVISAVSGLNLQTTGTATFDHPTDTPIYATKYDQVVFKRSTSGTTGSATAMTDGTITIQPDQLYTQFDDTSSASGYAYKACFRNSASGSVTTDSEWLTTSGYSFYSRSKIRDRIRSKMYDSSFIPDDDTINDWVNEWLEIMNNSAVHVNKDYSMGTVDVAFGTAGLGTLTSTDFKDIRKMDVTVDGVNWYTARRISQTDFIPNQIFLNTAPVYYPFGDSVFGVKPDGASGTARLSYYTLATILNDDADELPVPMRAYTKSFVDYGLAQALQVDNKPDQSQAKLVEAERGKAMFISDITPRSYSGPQYIKIVDDLGEYDDDLL